MGKESPHHAIERHSEMPSGGREGGEGVNLPLYLNLFFNSNWPKLPPSFVLPPLVLLYNCPEADHQKQKDSKECAQSRILPLYS
jgi:hypothetical protein